MGRFLLLLFAVSFKVWAESPPLPSFVSEYLIENDAELAPPRGIFDESSLTTYGRKGTTEPWSVTADFDGDGKLDWAGLLRDSNGKLLLIAVYSQDRTYFRVTLAKLGEDEGYLNTGVQLREPGIVHGIPISSSEGLPELRLERPGIHLIYFEKASVLYYWESGGFRELVTSD